MKGQRPLAEGSADRELDQTADVDKTLVAELLRLSTLERLRHNDRMVETVRQLRAALLPRTLFEGVAYQLCDGHRALCAHSAHAG